METLTEEIMPQRNVEKKMFYVPFEGLDSPEIDILQHALNIAEEAEEDDEGFEWFMPTKIISIIKNNTYPPRMLYEIGEQFRIHIVEEDRDCCISEIQEPYLSIIKKVLLKIDYLKIAQVVLQQYEDYIRETNSFDPSTLNHS